MDGESVMKKSTLWIWNSLLAAALLLSACQAAAPKQTENKKSIVVTYSILGSLVKDLVGDRADVTVLMPNGKDPHEWEPSAKDIEVLNHADLVVQNGLNLEGGMQNALQNAEKSGVKFFTASDAITVRKVGAGEGIPSGDPDQAVGAEDPHLWMDPVDMKQVVDALAVQIKTDLGIDLADRAKDLDARLDALNTEVAKQVNTLPAENRKLVTGHESLGYYAQRYGFKLVGAIIPSLTTQAQVSAADMAALKKLVEENKVKAVFTELGTPAAVAESISQDCGVKSVELTTHSLPEDGSYFTFMRNLTDVLAENLK
jgi:zinc/manganese transport system substrate-binding protein